LEGNGALFESGLRVVLCCVAGFLASGIDQMRSISGPDAGLYAIISVRALQQFEDIDSWC
jgi:hypothetical protein